MKRMIGRLLAAIVMLWIAAAVIGPGPSVAADMRTARNAGPATSLSTSRPAWLPFARSERAQAVWAGSACWRDCGAYCAWGQTACLSRDAQGQCLKRTDDCDRTCQRNCRTAGGPFLPLDF